MADDFAIADFSGIEGPRAKSDFVDPTQRIRFSTWTIADRARRQTIEAIQTCETPEAVEDFVRRESLLIDALHLFDPDMAASVDEAARDQIAWTTPRPEPRPEEPGPTSRNTRHTMTTKHNDFKKFVFSDVTFQWPKVDQPYRFNSQKQESEPCAPNVQGAAYSIAWRMPYAEAKAIFAEMKQHYADCRAANPKLPEFKRVFGLKKIEDEKTGEEVGQFTAKRNAVKANGAETKPPVVVDEALQPLADRSFWSGSKGSVRVLAFPATDPQTKEGGLSLLLDAIQVTEAVYGGDNLEDDFGPAKPKSTGFGDMEADEDFSDPKPHDAPAPAGEYEF